MFPSDLGAFPEDGAVVMMSGSVELGYSGVQKCNFWLAYIVFGSLRSVSQMSGS